MAFKDFFKNKTDDLTKINGFDNDLAKQISWEQVRKRSGSNFKTHFAVIENSSLLRFKPSLFMLLLPWLIIGFSLALLYVFNDFNVNLSEFSLQSSDGLIMAGVIVLMLGMGLFTLIKSRRNIIFDRRTGYYYKGLKNIEVKAPQGGKRCTRLNNVYAIQIISEIIRSKNSRYRSYELNLVLKNGNRLNVIDHANQESIRNDANLLGRFLDVPVWDVTI